MASFTDRRHNLTIVDNEIWTVYGDQLGPNGIHVYITLASLLNREEKDNVEVSYEGLAVEARLGLTSVKAEVKKLVELKLVVRESTTGPKGRSKNAYQLPPVPIPIGRHTTTDRFPIGRHTTDNKELSSSKTQKRSNKETSATSSHRSKQRSEPKKKTAPRRPAKAHPAHQPWVDAIYEALGGEAKGVNPKEYVRSVSGLLKTHPDADPAELSAFVEWYEEEIVPEFKSGNSVEKYFGRYRAARDEGAKQEAAQRARLERQLKLVPKEEPAPVERTGPLNGAQRMIMERFGARYGVKEGGRG